MINYKSFTIFNGLVTVNIDVNSVEKYENHVGPFSEKTAEYLAVTSGYDETSSVEDIVMGIKEGIDEESEVYDNRDNIIESAIEKGLIC